MKRLIFTVVCFSIISCTDAQKKNVPAAGKQATTTKKEKQDNRSLNNEAKENQANSSATISPGKWKAIVTNGYKGDAITFTVSADGKRVENVEFTGYWRSRSNSIEMLRHLDPPNPFTIEKGSFGAVQQVEKSAMWWEVTGKFTSATTAEGTYRAAFAGGENDTYKLKWTAVRL